MILKFLVIAGLLIVGAFFLAKGLGVDIPVVKYNGLEANNVPVGVVLLVIAVAIAKFWKIQKTETREETTTKTTKDGTTETTTITRTTTSAGTSMARPRDDKET